MIGSGIGRKIVGAEKMCAMAHTAAAQSASWHIGQGVDFEFSGIRKMALADLPGNPVPGG